MRGNMSITYINAAAKQAAIAKQEAIAAYHKARRAYPVSREQVGLQIDGRIVIELDDGAKVCRIARKLDRLGVSRIKVLHYR